MLLLLMLCGYNCSGVGLVGLAVTMNISMAWDVSGFEARSIFDRIEATATQVDATPGPRCSSSLGSQSCLSVCLC